MKEVTLPLEVIYQTLDAILFVVNPYLENVMSYEEATSLRDEYPWIADACDAFDRILMALPVELWEVDEKEYAILGL